uniref:hypothetical protein n=1 Tax=Candidatus Fimivicinus sp. TaxID=3056640 RepID=UPI003FEDFF59
MKPPKAGVKIGGETSLYGTESQNALPFGCQPSNGGAFFGADGRIIAPQSYFAERSILKGI